MNPPPEPTETIAILAELIRTYFGFDRTPPRVVIYNSGWLIPEIPGLFIELSIISDKEYAAGLTYADPPDGSPPGLNEEQTSNQQVLYAIDLFSKNSEARSRRNEVRFALQGTIAEMAMERHAIRIGRPTAFQDISQVEASRRLNRWQALFNVLDKSSSCRPIPYFDQFQIPPAPILINQ